MRLNCKGAGTGLTPDAEVPGAVPLHPLRPSERSVRSQRSRPEKGPRQPALKSWARDRHLGRGVAKKPFVVAGTVRSGRFEGRSGSERSTEHGSSTKPLHRGHGLTTLSLPGRLKRKSWFIVVFPWKRLGRRGSRGSGMRMRFKAILQRRCPRCLRGQVFTSAFRMRQNCGICDLRFDRQEQGYFVGAMYFAYGLAVLLGAPPAVYLWWQGFSTWVWVLVMTGELILFSPWIFQYSRIMFLHLDHLFDPT